MKNRAYAFLSLFFFLLFLFVMAVHFHIVWLPLACLLAGFLARIALPSAYLEVFSFLIPVLPAVSALGNRGFPLNYLLLPVFFLCGLVAADRAGKRGPGAGSFPELPRFYFTFLMMLGISFAFVMLRWSNLTLSPLAFFRDTPVSPTGQRLSFGIVFPVVEAALFMLTPCYYFLLRRLADRRRVLVAFLAGHSLSVVFSLCQRLQGAHAAGSQLRGLASDATAFGFLSALSLFLAWYLYAHYAQRWLGAIFFSVSLIGILSASTRIGLFAVALAVPLFVFSSRKKLVSAAWMLVILAAFLFLYMHFFHRSGANFFLRLKNNVFDVAQILQSKNERAFVGDLLSHRNVLGRYVWECLQAFPATGAGTGNFVFWAMSRHMADTFHHLPANQYFFIASSLGIPGVVVFLLFCGALFPGKGWREKLLLAVFLASFLFNDYLWFPEIVLAFWLVASLGEKGPEVRPARWKKAWILVLCALLAYVFFHWQTFSDLHPKTWARANDVAYDYGLSYVEHDNGRRFQWTGEKAGLYVYLDGNGRNGDYRLACGAPLASLKNRAQVVDLYWRGRFFKRVVFRRNEEIPITIEDKDSREGFLEIRVRPAFNLKRMRLGRESRTLGVQLFGGGKAT